MYRPVLLTFGTVAALAAGSMLAHGRDAAAPLVAGPVASAPEAPRDGVERMNDALAAAVIGSISRQFDTGDVTVQLGDVDVLPTSIRDRELRGTGRLRIDGDPQWIDFSFAALYDTQNTEVTYPRLRLQGAAPASAADAALVRSLQAKVASALDAEFAGQPVAWTQGATTVSGPQQRFLRVSGAGVADFGSEGRVDARVEALYDRDTGRWLRVSYDLSPTSEAEITGQAVASL